MASETGFDPKNSLRAGRRGHPPLRGAAAKVAHVSVLDGGGYEALRKDDQAPVWQLPGRYPAGRVLVVKPVWNG